MKLWIDTEWNEPVYRTDDFAHALISIALIDENGLEFYRSVGCDTPNWWIAEHVMPVIGIEPVSHLTLQSDLEAWLGNYETIHVIADWPEDIEHFCRLLITGPGTRLHTPPLTMEVDRALGDIPSLIPHNALADARANRAQALGVKP